MKERVGVEIDKIKNVENGEVEMKNEIEDREIKNFEVGKKEKKKGGRISKREEMEGKIGRIVK